MAYQRASNRIDIYRGLLLATLMESGVEFVAVDNPHANKLTIHILAAVNTSARRSQNVPRRL
jgi:hypothetical protein